MDEDFHDQLYASLNQRETNELREILRKNDRRAWSDAAFDVIQEILQNRPEYTPPKVEAVVEPEEERSEPLPENNPKKKYFLNGIACFLVSAFLVYLSSLRGSDPSRSFNQLLDRLFFWGVVLGIWGIFHWLRALFWSNIRMVPRGKPYSGKKRWPAKPK